MNPEHIKSIIQRVIGGIMNNSEDAIKDWGRKSNPEEERKKLIEEMQGKYPQPPDQGLCWKCRRWLENEYGTMNPEPWEYCHHEEPEIDYNKPCKVTVDKIITYPGSLHYQPEPPEKPKELCWCEMKIRPAKTRELDNNLHKSWDILFCPVCARKL